MDEIQLPDIVLNEIGETLQLPSPFLYDYYKNRQERVYEINGEITNETVDIVRAIARINIEDKGKAPFERKPIKIIIDTPGGDISVMWSIVCAIEASKTPVYTYNLCHALSAGAHILASGHKRYAFPGSAVLIHSGSQCISGDVEKVENAKKFFDGISAQANDRLLAHTKIPAKLLKRKAVSDWYITTQESLDLGIVDEIITDFSGAF